MGEGRDPDRRVGGGSEAGAGELVAVGCALGVLVGLAATWLSLVPLSGNWAECDAEPGTRFGLVLVLPALFAVHSGAFALNYGLLRARAGWAVALAGALLAVAVLVLVAGQVLLAQLGLPDELCALATRSPARFPGDG